VTAVLVALVTGAVGIAIALGGLLVRSWSARFKSQNLRQQFRQRQIDHVLRLVGEIASVAKSIESDLGPFRSIPSLGDLQTRARRLRLRAEAACVHERLRDLPLFELEAQVAQIHADHLKIVGMRAMADSEIRDWRRHVNRKVETANKSSWPFSSTPLSSGLDA
jgi:hypothetical protein